MKEKGKVEKQTVDKKKLGNQIVGNVGLYYACYQLSRKGLNVMPTARNAKGIDIVAYKGENFIGIQVKALSKKNPVPMGSSINTKGDFWIIVVNASNDTPTTYILDTKTFGFDKKVHKGKKNGNLSCWLQPKSYDKPEYENRWDIIVNKLDSMSQNKDEADK